MQALGWLPEQGCFRLAAPTAEHVELVERRHPEREPQRVTAMRRVTLEPGREVWQADVAEPLGCYRFRVHFPWGSANLADPWARTVVRKKVLGHPTWAAATPPLPRATGGVRLDPASVVLLEAHVGDQTAHASAGVLSRGTYAGLVEGLAEGHAAAIGGAAHAVRLGVDAIELLPLTTWPVREGQRDNHWGYMPSYLCAVSHRYTEAWQQAPEGAWVGIDASGEVHDPARELRRMVDALHARGVGVVVDLVYNHVSTHDSNPLLLLDPGTWFHRAAGGALRSHSGCGNDLDSRDPEMRALLVASLRRWFVEIGVDGVRLDLAELLDDVTLTALRDTARAARPDALLIAEPWSLGGYRPEQLASLGWAVWDDHYRNGLKGSEPGAPGPLVRAAPVAPESLRRWLGGGGWDVGGRLPSARLGVSYLESHDGYTLADFVRLASGEVGFGERIAPDAVARPSAEVSRTLRLAHALLAATRGPIMLHQGQSFARAKLRAAPGSTWGALDHNSYDRDDATNHIDWAARARAAELVAWTGQWIAARRRWLAPAFAADAPLDFVADTPDGCAAYVVGVAPTSDDPRGLRAVAFACNLGPAAAALHLPGEGWHLLIADAAVRAAGPPRVQAGASGVHLPPRSAALWGRT